MTEILKDGNTINRVKSRFICSFSRDFFIMPSVFFPIILLCLVLSFPSAAQEQTSQNNVETERPLSSFLQKTKNLFSDKKSLIKPLIEQSITLYQQKDFQGALKSINQAIEIDPEMAPLYNDRGIIQLALDNSKDALHDLDQAIKLSPNVAIFYNTRGTTLLKLGRYRQALSDFDQALRLEPNYLVAYNNRGLAHVALSQNEQALSDFNTVIQRDPKNTAAYNNRGLVMLDQQKITEALQDFQAAIQSNPIAGIPYNNRGIIHHLLGQKRARDADYQNALTFDPVYFSKNAKIGDATYIFDNDLEKALVNENALSHDPKTQKQFTRFSTELEQTGGEQGKINTVWENEFKDKIYYLFLIPIFILLGGLILLWWKHRSEPNMPFFPFWKEKKPKEYVFTPRDEAAEYVKVGLQKMKHQPDYKAAITNFTYAIDIEKNYMEAYYYRGISKLEIKDYKSALDDFTKAIKLLPENPKAFNNRGYAYAELGMFQEALKDFSKAIEIKVDYALAYNNRGNTYSDLQDYQKAIEDYDQALTYDKKANAHVYYNNRGNAKAFLKQYHEAIADYNEAIRIAPSYMTVYINRGHAKYEQGDQRTAMLDYNRARQLYPNENFSNRERKKQTLIDLT